MALHFKYTYFWNSRVKNKGRKLNKGMDLTNEHILCLLTGAGFLGASYGSLLPHGQKSHVGPCISRVLLEFRPRDLCRWLLREL